MALFDFMEEKKVELLAPAGNYESFLGAVCAGADAVYLGGEKFGARAYADNFSEEEICRAISYAHVFGRKVYLTVNTLMKESEFGELIPYLEPFYLAGLDGVIVQDIGVLLAIKEAFPGLELHASTQMTITGSYGAKMLKELGVVRIVPARELSLAEIESLRQETGLEIETFIHGAMCYCYSGQCLFSSILGGRSGNRGRCAQPCRLPYRIDGDGKPGAQQYPLSLKDMCTISFLPKLIEAGISSFKIEGRMKKPEYAAGVTAIYRKYIDLYYKEGAAAYAVKEEDLRQLSSLYIRTGIQEGYYFRQNGAEMVTLDSPAYTGSDEKLLDAIRKKYIEKPLKKKLHMKAVFSEGERAALTLSCETDKPLQSNKECRSVNVYGEKVVLAGKQPVTEENIRNGLMKLGNTPFYAEPADMEIRLEEGVFYPLKAINDLRRKGVEQLLGILGYERALEKTEETAPKQYVNEKEREDTKSAGDAGERKKSTAFNVLVSTRKQLEAVMETDIPVESICLESDMPELSVKLLEDCRKQAAQKPGRIRFLIALPYIVRKNNMEQMDAVYNLVKEADGCLVRNLESLQWLKEREYAGEKRLDAGIYCFNRRTMDFYMEQADGCCLPYELNRKESRRLLEKATGKTEQVVYGRIPLMITANCIAKTAGKCKKSSQAKEEKSVFFLEDRYKKNFPVSIHCRYCYNIIYNAVPLSLHEKVLKKEVLCGMRLCFTTETGKETESILQFFSERIKGVEKKPPFAEYTLGHEKRGVE